MPSHKLIQCTKEEAKTAVRSGFVSHAILLMPSSAMNASLWFDGICKKPLVKADLAIYDPVLGVSG